MGIVETEIMTNAKLTLLGPPRLEADQQLVDLTLRKAVALLAYLVAGSHSTSLQAGIAPPSTAQA